MTLTLRDYQRRSLDSLYRVWRTKQMRNPLLVLPTAAGKGSIIAGFCMEALQQYPTTRLGFFAHRPELVEQNYKRLKAAWPDAPAGIYANKLKRRDTHSPIIFGMIQSCYDKAEQFGGFDVAGIDEAHLVGRDANSMYGRFLDGCLSQRSHTKFFGLTATEFRMDSGMLTDHFKDQPPLFDGIAEKVEIRELLDKGYLCPLEPAGTAQYYDRKALKKADTASKMSAIMDRNEINEKIVREAIKLGQGRKHWIVFCVDLQHAYNICDLLNANGIRSAVVSGEPNKQKHRKWALEEYAAGRLQALVNVDVLTTGFDFPPLDYIVLLRFTMSPGLYIQMLGRGMRLFAGKLNCLVADFAGNSFEHGPIDQIEGIRKADLPERVVLSRAAAAAACPACLLDVPPQSRSCPHCGYELPYDPYQALAEEASGLALISGGPGGPQQVVTNLPFRTDWKPCTSVAYDFIPRSGGEALRVSYNVGLKNPATEIVDVRGLADWWKRHSSTGLVPADMQMARYMIKDLKPPKEVLTYRNQSYLNAIDARF